MKPKIIQILMTPEGSKWQSNLLGLSDEGVVYESSCGYWKPFIAPLGYEKEEPSTREEL